MKTELRKRLPRIGVGRVTERWSSFMLVGSSWREEWGALKGKERMQPVIADCNAAVALALFSATAAWEKREKRKCERVAINSPRSVHNGGYKRRASVVR
jgi:hypothetical protein